MDSFNRRQGNLQAVRVQYLLIILSPSIKEIQWKND